MTTLRYYCKLNTIDVVTLLKKTNFSFENEKKFDDQFLRLFKADRKLLFGNLEFKKVGFEVYSEFYKNEFIIKNAFINGKLMNSKAVCSEEYPLLGSRIDLISINGKSIAYEIKTKYDTLKRLNKQLNDYSKCFEYVYVICSESKLTKVMSQVPEFVGIYSYSDSTNKNIFVLRKDASYSPNINANSILRVLSATEKCKLFKTNVDSKIVETYSFDKILFKFKSLLKRKYLKKSIQLRQESISLVN